MIKNAKQFWRWWTSELKIWLTDKFDNITFDKSDLAKESNATANKQTILAKLDAIHIDLTPVLQAIESAKAYLKGKLDEAVTTLGGWFTSGKQEILAAIGDIDIPTGDLAKESTLQGVVDKVGDFTDPTETIAHKLENLNIDTTELAKQGTDSTATLTATQAYAQQAAEKVVPTDYAKASDIPTTSDIADAVEDKLPTDYAKQTDVLTAIAAVQASSYKGVPSIAASGNITAMPNQLYVWSAAVGALTITKGTEQAGIVNEYIFRFSGATSVTFAGWTLTWNGGDAPSWDATKTYEISIVDNIALYAEL